MKVQKPVLAKALSLTLSVLSVTGIAGTVSAQTYSKRLTHAPKTSETIVVSTQLPSRTLEQTPIASKATQSTIFGYNLLVAGGVGLLALAILILFASRLSGLVIINEKQVGIVVKKFSSRSLPTGKLIALNGEAGYQADTLAPGCHFGYWPWQYEVRKESLVVIAQDEIGLVVAHDGQSIPPERILGQCVECNDFQDARKFLVGGERGQQLGFLTSGTYRINTALFTVITVANAAKHGMTPEQLKVCTINPDMVGVVTTYDGIPIEEGDIAGPIIPNHDSFQNGQRFIEGGGRRGLQEEILLSGSWNLNPWFVQVEQVPMTEIPIGYVGVVISYVGQSDEDRTGDAFTYGNLVNQGDKGVWLTPLYPGRHALNTHIMSVELVPTTDTVLNFSYREEEHGYDHKLNALKVLSKDGFAYEIEIGQIIHVGALDAPKVISQVGSMQNLVDNVMRPLIRNYFRNSAQAYTVLEWVNARQARQEEAADYIRQALRVYNVEAVDSLLGALFPPDALMQTLTDRKMAEEQQKTYEVQCQAQTKRQALVRQTALADIQEEMVSAEQSVQIAESRASAQVKEATGEAEATRLTGDAKADAYRAGVAALGSQAYTALQLMQVIGDRSVRVVPDVSVSGGGNGSGLIDALLGTMMWQQTQNNSQTPDSHLTDATHSEYQSDASKISSPMETPSPLDAEVIDS